MLIVGVLFGIGSVYLVIECEELLDLILVDVWCVYLRVGIFEVDFYLVVIYICGGNVLLVFGEGFVLVVCEDSFG